MPTWIDFKELRSQLSFEEVLRHHGVEIKAKNGQHMGYCPLPGHDGKRKAMSFSANLDRGIFNCFVCAGKGNVIDFAVLMSGESTEDGRAVKKVAAALRAQFCPGESSRPAKAKDKNEDEPPKEQMELGTIVNPPLDFKLQGLDPAHPYLVERRFAKETIAHFGLGYSERGSLAGRIAIPLHDAAGQLIGYAGRVVDDKAVTEENPRYRMPGKRNRDGAVLEFRKSQFLYNGHRIKSARENLGVVTGFPSVWWLHQNGFPCVVSTMGAECSKEQAAAIVALVRPGGRVWILPDGDKEGERFAQSLLFQISPYRAVRWVKLEDGRRPIDLSVHEMKTCFTE